MATEDFSGNSNYELQATIARSGQTVTVSTIRVRRKTGTGYWTNSPYDWEVSIGVVDWSGTWTYDFTGGTTYQTVTSNRSRSGIPAGSTFNVRVYAQMGSGIGSATIIQSVSIPDTPNTVGTPSLGSATTSQFVVDWNAPSNGGSAITGYEIQVNTSASASGATTYSQGTSTSRTITGRNPARRYYARVRAENAMGFGGWSNWASIETIPVAPTSPLASNETASDITFGWGAGSNGPDIEEYEFSINTSASSSGATTVSNGTATTRTVTRPPATTYYVRVRARSASGWGAWSPWGNGTTLPVAPGSPALGSPTISSLTMTYTAATNGNVLEYQIQHNSSASETGATTVSNGTDLSRIISGLDAASTRYARVRARSASGWGAWSAWVSGDTLPASPPGLAIAPSASGAQAVVSLSPPSGVTTVTKYQVQYRRGASGAVTTFETTSTSATRSGLVPGAVYQWRASAFIGTYQTPWSAWTNILQPNPTWVPGDYLAGSLAAGLDVTYAWTGTANGSTSTATGKGVTGWATDAGAAVALHRITGGLFGTYAARMLVLVDTAQVGVGQGTAAGQRSDVSPGGIYAASMYVRTQRELSMRLEVTWLNGAGTWIGVAASSYVTVAPGDWVRLSTLAQAPVGAAFASVRVKNAASTPLLSGDYIDYDGQMLTVGALYPYFDGSFPDTSEYDYAWTGAAHASTSSRTTLSQSTVDPLQDPDCPPIPLPPAPPPIAAECIDEVGTWRRYWSILPQSEITRWLALIPTFTLTTTAAVGQVRIRVYENPDNLAPADLDVNGYISEQLVTFIPGNTQMVIDGVSERVRASVAGGDWLSADHLLQGTDGGPATWPELSCGQGYVISYDVPLDQPDGNMTPAVQLTGRY